MIDGWCMVMDDGWTNRDKHWTMDNYGGRGHQRREKEREREIERHTKRIERTHSGRTKLNSWIGMDPDR